MQRTRGILCPQKNVLIHRAMGYLDATVGTAPKNRYYIGECVRIHVYLELCLLCLGTFYSYRDVPEFRSVREAIDHCISMAAPGLAADAVIGPCEATIMSLFFCLFCIKAVVSLLMWASTVDEV